MERKRDHKCKGKVQDAESSSDADDISDFEEVAPVVAQSAPSEKSKKIYFTPDDATSQRLVVVLDNASLETA